MPPKAKILKNMIIDAAFQIARLDGADKITARSISEQLKCSTQPVLYYFAAVEETFLFHFLFQSNEFSGTSLSELVQKD